MARTTPRWWRTWPRRPASDWRAPAGGPPRARRAALRGRAPSPTLIDGRGVRWTPWSTDPAALRDYTLGEQVTTPYRFAVSVRVALREEGPGVLVLPGPGNSLGGICGQLVVAEGYH